MMMLNKEILLTDDVLKINGVSIPLKKITGVRLHITKKDDNAFLVLFYSDKIKLNDEVILNHQWFHLDSIRHYSNERVGLMKDNYWRLVSRLDTDNHLIPKTQNLLIKYKEDLEGYQND